MAPAMAVLMPDNIVVIERWPELACCVCCPCCCVCCPCCCAVSSSGVVSKSNLVRIFLKSFIILVLQSAWGHFSVATDHAKYRVYWYHGVLELSNRSVGSVSPSGFLQSYG